MRAGSPIVYTSGRKGVPLVMSFAFPKVAKENARKVDALLAGVAGPFLDKLLDAEENNTVKNIQDIYWRHDASFSIPESVYTVVRFFYNAPVTHIVRSVETKIQRMQRGWGDTDTWNMDVYLARVIGGQLAYLAENTHTYPGNDEFPTPESWSAALTENSKMLLVYADEQWNGPETETFEEENTRVAKLHEDARKAMGWVAEHFSHLWD